MIELLFLINSARVQPLRLDADLSLRAQSRAQYLCNHPFSHAGWIAWTNGLPGYVGENLAKGFKSAKATHNALLASPTHKANIVSEKYHRVGIGEACGVTVELFAQ